MNRIIKTIIHISDIHIRKMQRHTEYREVIDALIVRLKEVITPANKDSFVIVITGDIVHQKIDITNEQVMLVKEMFIKLLDITDVIVIAGNHDMLVHNKDRMDSLTPIIDGIHSDSLHYYKESKCYGFNNIIFANYSVFEDNRRPNIEEAKKTYPTEDYKYIGLYHAPLQGSKTEMGFSGFDYADNVGIFEGLDFVMCGDIHLHQEVKADIPVVYAGSLIQQSYGENISGHGFVVWSVESRKYKLVEIPNKHTMVKIQFSGIDSLDNDEYTILNK